LEDESNFDIQDKILFEVFLESANRVGAISKLTLSSMCLEELVFKDIREKRGYRVEVLISELGRDLIEEWLAIRKERMDNLEVDALFITRYRGKYNQMKYKTIQDRIKEIGKIVGIDDFHCHAMRKTKINEVYETTGDLSMASSYANHKGTDVTLLYLKPKSKKQLRDKIAEINKKYDDGKKFPDWEDGEQLKFLMYYDNEECLVCTGGYRNVQHKPNELYIRIKEGSGLQEIMELFKIWIKL
jgi:integrase/recombinase XerC